MDKAKQRIKGKRVLDISSDVELNSRCEQVLRWRDSEAFELNNRNNVDGEAFQYGVFIINKDWTKCTMLIFWDKVDAVLELSDIMDDCLAAEETVTVYANAELG